MLNKYPLWKYLVILAAVVISCIYAAPNMYPEDPAVQISETRSSGALSDLKLKEIRQTLDQAGIDILLEEKGDKKALFRFKSGEDQLNAKPLIEGVLGRDFIVALNMASTTPDWLSSLGAGPMKLGLDLRGGVHFLLEVDMEKAISQRMDVYVGEIKRVLKEEDIRYRRVELAQESSLEITFRKAEDREAGRSLLRSEYNEFEAAEREDDQYFYLALKLTPQKIKEIKDYAITQNLTTLRNRVNELGVAEPLVQRQGQDRIVVQLPGVQDTAAAKRVLGATANLQFRLEALPDASITQRQAFSFRDNPNRRANIEKDIIITGESVSTASLGFDENGLPQVNITLDASGGKLMHRVTRKAVGRKMAVIFIEHKTRTVKKLVDGELVDERQKYSEQGIISLATIQSPLGSSFRITGLDSPQEASDLSLLLRAGSLAAPIYFVEERTVGPSLGQENIDLGVTSVQIGLALVLICMLVFYRVFGLVANLALVLNLVILVAVMSLMSATLTLPGIAGIVLTVGMAVDANVLIFSRIREELNNGVPPQSAIHAGYERAFVTIFDANLTTLIVAVILFSVGSGPVKGFAVTLMVGIITSMFTAIMVSRGLINLIYGGRNIQSVSIGGVK
ncbi:protein translocase subunit SecD [Litoribrevibacter albus]|uniref:Protein translocase subunit SecD n=1 Tax=Litoribrevibacter albus TaxID=1473156 RepID=A0AA37W766_9GAMM|nr:protein translocase subunit SecD [Litoribrevibacter albus]GLQ31048.1 protein translocase subunit SecD [Litoribrevibacter albus]